MRIRVVSQGNWWRFLQNDFRLQSRFEWLIMHSFKWPAHVAARDVLSKPLLSIFIIVSSGGGEGEGRAGVAACLMCPLLMLFYLSLAVRLLGIVSVFVFLTLEWHKNTHTPTHTHRDTHTVVWIQQHLPLFRQPQVSGRTEAPLSELSSFI